MVMMIETWFAVVVRDETQMGDWFHNGSGIEKVRNEEDILNVKGV